jgi:Spy/CpxP family protein refolding chaperone
MKQFFNSARVAYLCFLVTLITLCSLSQVNADVTIKNTKPVSQKIERGTSPLSGLSAENRKEFERLTSEYNNQLSELKPQVKEKQKILKTELAKETLNYQTLQNVNKELYSLREQEQLARIKYQVALSKFLTVKQRKSLAKNAKPISSK